jgi:predicted Zn-dependent protease with MMP-like domain
MPEKPTVNLAGLRAPDIAAFEAMADEAFRRLPGSFRRLCEGVVIRIEDFPDDETLDELEAESPFDLLGLFRGTGLAQGGATPQTGQFPNMVWLYRRPILDYWAEHDETLGHIVRHVLVHEIGHHFGLDDADMEAIERAAE